MLKRKQALPSKKLTSYNPNRLYFTTLDKNNYNLRGGTNEIRFDRVDW